jgi:UDP-N-acetylmuramate--alanine ligase
MSRMFKEPRRIHFVGIGGVGMSGIAEVLLTLRHRVSGSDIAESEITRRLVARGASISYGHSAEAITPDIDVVVISSAVKFSNPEVVRARALKIPVIPRAEMLAELMRLKHGIAVAGTHGKTTTTSLIAAILARADMDPTMVIGGKMHAMGSNARLGQGELLVAEADESDGTFLLLSPVIAVVTNIDPEHLDYYGDMDRVRSAYLEFMNRVPFYGVSVLCLDNVNVRSLLPQVRKRVITYGTTDDCDYVARDLCVIGMETLCEVVRRGALLGTLRLRLPGRHHALNAIAAIAVAEQLGVPFETAREALTDFGGIHRRFELCGEAGGVMVISDYGHHPTEIRATLAAAKLGSGGRRIVVLFQPHRYTRTHDLMQEFARSFNNADMLFITDIYAASEDPIEGVTAEALTAAIKRFGHKDANYIGALDNAASILRDHVQPGDLVLTLGAGTVNRVSDQLLFLLREQSVATN